MGSQTTANKHKLKIARRMRRLKTPVVEIARKLGVNTTTIYKWTEGIGCPYYNPRYNIECINNEYFSRQNLAKYPERFVIIGFIAADGCISDTKTGQKTLCFNISQKDKIALEIINQEIAEGKRKISDVAKTNSCMIAFPSNTICRDLEKFGIVPRKTKNFKLPNLSKLQMQHFLRGYFYGDGCLYYPERAAHRMYQFIGTKEFIMKLSEYLVQQKIVSSAPYYKIGDNGYKQMHIKGSKTEAFGKYMFFDDNLILIPRKHRIITSVIRGSRWSEDEKALLHRTSLEKFCELTGRTLGAAKAQMDKQHPLLV